MSNNTVHLEKLEASDLEVVGESEGLGYITLHQKREPLVIKEAYYRGNHRISLRFHYPDKRDGVYRPGRRGVEIPIEAARAVAQAINELMDSIEAREDD